MKLLKTLKMVGILAALMFADSCLHTPPCPEPSDLQSEHLYGRWLVQVAGEPRLWFLQLGPHPDYETGLLGSIHKGSHSLPVEANLNDGELGLHENLDDKKILAIWTGKVNAGSCGNSLSGQRQTGYNKFTTFVMHRHQAL